jgi:hypothetical protein
MRGLPARHNSSSRSLARDPASLARFHAAKAADDDVLLQDGDLRLDEVPVRALELLLPGKGRMIGLSVRSVN